MFDRFLYWIYIIPHICDMRDIIYTFSIHQEYVNLEQREKTGLTANEVFGVLAELSLKAE